MQSNETRQSSPTGSAAAGFASGAATNHMMNPQSSPIANTSTTKQRKKRGLVIGVIATAVVAVVIIALIMILGGAGGASPSQLNMDSPIKVTKGGKYGFIDTNGNWLVEPMYDGADDFCGDFAIVMSETSDANGIKLKLYQLIDRNGNVKATSDLYSGIKYIYEANVWVVDEQLYDASLRKLSPDDMEVRHADGEYFAWENNKNNTAGIMNASGKVTYTYQYADDESYLGVNYETVDESLADHYCVITIENEKYGIVNCDTGKLVYDYTDKYLSNEGDNIFEELVHDGFDFVSIMYIQDDKIAYQSFNEEVDLSYSPGYVWIDDESKVYSEQNSYFDIATGQVTKTRPEVQKKSELEENTGYITFQCGSGYGLMSGEKVVIPCEWTSLKLIANLDMYQYLKSIGKEYVFGGKDGAVSLIDIRSGQIVATFNTDNVRDYGDSIFISYEDKDTGEEVIYNLVTGNSMRTDSNNTLYRKLNYFMLEENGAMNYYNGDFRLIYTRETNE